MIADVKEFESRLCLADAAARTASAVLFCYGASTRSPVQARALAVCVILGLASVCFLTAWVVHRLPPRPKRGLAGKLVTVWWWQLAGTVAAGIAVVAMGWWAVGVDSLLEAVLLASALYLVVLSVKDGHRVLDLVHQRLLSIQQQ